MEKRNSFCIVTITLVATLGGLLFGYDAAVISGADKSIQAYLIDGLGFYTDEHLKLLHKKSMYIVDI
jgi:SP family xylose:H+ symportor-like MFS transporter